MIYIIKWSWNVKYIRLGLGVGFGKRKLREKEGIDERTAESRNERVHVLCFLEEIRIRFEGQKVKKDDLTRHKRIELSRPWIDTTHVFCWWARRTRVHVEKNIIKYEVSDHILEDERHDQGKYCNGNWSHKEQEEWIPENTYVVKWRGTGSRLLAGSGLKERTRRDGEGKVKNISENSSWKTRKE